MLVFFGILFYEQSSKSIFLFQKAFSEEEGAAYAKYWAPGRHEDIGLFNNWIGANK